MGLQRYLRFNAIGVAGFVVQLAVVALLTDMCRATPLLATAIAVEAAVLHNFFWHERWTWADRPCAGRARLARLGRFHLANGLVSIVGNLAVVATLAGLNPIAANAIAVLACSIVTFAAGDRLVFSPGPWPASGLSQSLRAGQSSPTYP
ncbi:MAG: GtrA family protein [Vicinamibacterales bacterium]